MSAEDKANSTSIDELEKQLGDIKINEDSSSSSGSIKVQPSPALSDIKLKETSSSLLTPIKDLPPTVSDDKKQALKSIAQLILDGECKNVIFMVGAGISTSVGIPDFRTKGSGLFDKLQKYKLPFKEAIFDIDYFRKNPQPFFDLSRELLPGNFEPSLCHYFMNLFAKKDILLRVYTQNIDGLERLAGIPAEKLVESHGTFHTSHCTKRKCGQEYSLEWLMKTVLKPEPEDNVPVCDKCQSIVKPDITFYGEMLPDRYYELTESDFKKCDLLIIMGTSLQVHPFASLANLVGKDVKRLMINFTKPGHIDWSSKKNHRNVHVQLDTDSGSRELAELLGWRKDLDRLYAQRSKTTVKEEKKTKKKKEDEEEGEEQ